MLVALCEGGTARRRQRMDRDVYAGGFSDDTKSMVVLIKRDAEVEEFDGKVTII